MKCISLDLVELGVTGFVGGFLLWELLRRPETGKLFCLVRCGSEEEGLKRIVGNLQRYDLLSSVSLDDTGNFNSFN